MMAYKEESVEANVKGVGFLLKKNKVAYRHGRARLVSAGAVEVGGERLQAPHIVIATGSDPAAFPNVKMDETRILSSTGALSLSSVPKSLAVVGAGYIGLEMGSVWRRLGAEVVILEALPRIAPGMDGEIARHLGRLLEKQGLRIRAGVKVKGIAAGKKGAEIAFADKNDALFVEKVLIAVGRTPLSGGLGLEALGVKISARASLRRTKPAGRLRRAFTRSAMSPAARCWRIRRLKRESSSPKISAASNPPLIGRRFRPSFTPIRKRRAWARPRRRSRRRGRITRQGAFLSRRTAAQSQSGGGGLRQDSRRERERQDFGRSYIRGGGRSDDRASRDGDGVRGGGGGFGADDSRPSDLKRGDEGSGAVGGEARASYVKARALGVRNFSH